MKWNWRWPAMQAASPELIAVINAINAANATLGTSCDINTLSIFDLGVETCETIPAYTEYDLQGCFSEWVSFLNTKVFPAFDATTYNVGYATDGNISFVPCDKDCYTAGAYNVGQDDPGVFIDGAFLGVANNHGSPVNPFTSPYGYAYLFVKPDNSLIDASAIEAILNYEVSNPANGVPPVWTNGTAPSSIQHGSTLVHYKALELLVQTASGTEVVYLYGPASCSFISETHHPSEVVCITEPSTETTAFDWSAAQNECLEDMMAIAAEQALIAYRDMRRKYLANLSNSYTEQCFPVAENFTVTYESQEHHYTLFYYDQAGNLVQTVPPEGVMPLPNEAFDADGNWDGVTEPGIANAGHLLRTEYAYNSLNELVAQHTPDGGTSKFWYDLKGRLVASQDASQADESIQLPTQSHKAHNYMVYDQQGRVVESGEVYVPDAQALDGLTEEVRDEVLNAATFPAAVTDASNTVIWDPTERREVHRTFYDAAPLATNVGNAFGGEGQQHLRNRIAHTTVQQVYDGDPLTYDHATHYSYDPHGNVNSLVMEQPRLAAIDQDLKRLDYKYDLISGNVNEVIYQAGATDQFIRQYCYDADNRLTIALSGPRKENLEQDAKYFYHLHGPLARVELGHDKVQATDFAYYHSKLAKRQQCRIA